MPNDVAPFEDSAGDYSTWVEDLKVRIYAAQSRAVLAVNSELVLLYWQIGNDILERQESQGWGTKVIERLAADLRSAFPEMRGFSSRNLRYMRAFAAAWPDKSFVQGVLAQLPWYHQIALIDKLPDADSRSWYANHAIEYGWSRNVLVLQIESGLKERTGAAQTNFEALMPPMQSDLARESFKDPYRFDFLNLGKEASERALESALVTHVTDFLLELGSGFAFVGSQVHLEVGGEDFYIDLLFYHLQLRCYVVIELKAGEFEPAHLGQLGFYLTAVDAQVKHGDDLPSIGLLLCKSKNKIVAEYALRDANRPLGIAEYQLVESLPDTLKSSLPTIEEIERELQGN